MWINSDNHVLGPLLSEKRGHRGRHADFETHWGKITPLLSQTAASRQLGGTPGRANLNCQFVLPLPATDQGHSLTGTLDRRTGLGNV